MAESRQGVHDFWWVARWVARLLGTLVGVGYLWGGLSALARGGWAQQSAADFLWLLALPAGVLAGYLLAWRRELVGAIIALACLLVMFAGAAIGGAQAPSVPHLCPFGGPALVFISVWTFSPRRGGREGRSRS